MFSKDHFEKLRPLLQNDDRSKTDKIMKIAFVLWFFWMLIWLSLVIGIIWAAIHFISKYW